MVAGAWFLVSGVMRVVFAIRVRKEIDNEWMLILHGLLTVLFGVFLLGNPVETGVVLMWMLGGYAIAAGVVMIVLAFRLKGHAKH